MLYYNRFDTECQGIDTAKTAFVLTNQTGRRSCAGTDTVSVSCLICMLPFSLIFTKHFSDIPSKPSSDFRPTKPSKTLGCENQIVLSIIYRNKTADKREPFGGYTDIRTVILCIKSLQFIGKKFHRTACVINSCISMYPHTKMVSKWCREIFCNSKRQHNRQKFLRHDCERSHAFCFEILP